MERVIKFAVIRFADSGQLMSKRQHGFLHERSCLTNLLNASEQWTRAVDKKAGVVVIYFDFKKAFDCVPHLIRWHYLKLCIQLWSLPEISSWSNFCSNLRYGMQSKASLKSKYMTSTPDFLSKARVHCSEKFRRSVRHDLPYLKPCCLVLVICFESENRAGATLRIRSITFEHVLVRLTGRKFFGSTRWLLNSFGKNPMAFLHLLLTSHTGKPTAMGQYL